jgi:hypothetical protein
VKQQSQLPKEKIKQKIESDYKCRPLTAVVFSLVKDNLVKGDNLEGFEHHALFSAFHLCANENLPAFYIHNLCAKRNSEL